MEAGQLLAQEFNTGISLDKELERFVSNDYPLSVNSDKSWGIGESFRLLNGQSMQLCQIIEHENGLKQLELKVQSHAKSIAVRVPYWGQMKASHLNAILDFVWNLGIIFYGDKAGFATIHFSQLAPMLAGARRWRPVFDLRQPRLVPRYLQRNRSN